MRLPDSLCCLQNRNLRLFFGGQMISMLGTWMQSVALQWLVWRLTGSAVALGEVAFLSQIPVLFLSAAAGALADRVPRIRVVVVAQIVLVLQALALWTLTARGTVDVTDLYVLSVLAGAAIAFEMPARQALLADLAGPHLPNAIAFNSSVVHATRVIGPAVGGVMVSAMGEGPCFLANALSYLPVVITLLMLRIELPHSREQAGGGLLEGFRYAWRTDHVRRLLGMVAMVSLCGLSFNTVLQPIFAEKTLGGGADLLGVLFSASGCGALLGAILLLRQRDLVGLPARVTTGGLLLGVNLLAFAWSRSIALSCVTQFFIGLGFMSVLASANTLVQALVLPELRGRVMGIFSMAFMGMTPIGSVIAGRLAGWLGTQPTLALGAAFVLVASLFSLTWTPGLRVTVARAS